MRLFGRKVVQFRRMVPVVSRMQETALRAARTYVFGLFIAVAACGEARVLDVARTRDFGDAASDVASAPAARDAADSRSVREPIAMAKVSGCLLAIDDSSVYFVSEATDSMEITKGPLAGGDPVVLARTAHPVTSLAVDSANLYFSETISEGPGLNRSGSTLNKVPLGGGVTESLGTVPLQVSALVAQGADLYATTLWRSTFDPSDQVPLGAVMRVPVRGGMPTTLVAGLEDAVDIAADATRIYWAHGFGAGCTWGCVMAIPLLGGAPTTIVSNATTTQQNIRAFTIDAADVYWTNEGIVSTVMRQALSGGTPITVASDQYEPYAIAVDAAYVYWTTYSGTVMRASRGGGAAIQIAQEKCTPCAIAVNDSSIYWIGCSELIRAAKVP
jgi:hypothetical protein